MIPVVTAANPAMICGVGFVAMLRVIGATMNVTPAFQSANSTGVCTRVPFSFRLFALRKRSAVAAGMRAAAVSAYDSDDPADHRTATVRQPAAAAETIATGRAGVFASVAFAIPAATVATSAAQKSMIWCCVGVLCGVNSADFAFTTTHTVPATVSATAAMNARDGVGVFVCVMIALRAIAVGIPEPPTVANVIGDTVLSRAATEHRTPPAQTDAIPCLSMEPSASAAEPSASSAVP